MSSMADVDPGIFELPYAERICQVTRYSISRLLDHYTQLHDDDDITTIIELPDDKDIKAIVLEPEMTLELRDLMGTAFPKVFGPEGVRVTAMELQVRQTQRDILALKSKNKNRSNAEKRKAQKARPKTDPNVYTAQELTDHDTPGYDEEEQSDSPPAARDDEYDPTRPAYLTPSKLDELRQSTVQHSTGPPVVFGLNEVTAALLRASTSWKGLDANEESSEANNSARKPKRQQDARRVSGPKGKKVDYYAMEIPDVIRAPSREPEPSKPQYQPPPTPQHAAPVQQIISGYYQPPTPVWPAGPLPAPAFDLRQYQPPPPPPPVAYRPEQQTYHQPYQTVDYGRPPPPQPPQERLRFRDEYGREVFPESFEPIYPTALPQPPPPPPPAGTILRRYAPDSPHFVYDHDAYRR